MIHEYYKNEIILGELYEFSGKHCSDTVLGFKSFKRGAVTNLDCHIMKVWTIDTLVMPFEFTNGNIVWHGVKSKAPKQGNYVTLLVSGYKWTLGCGPFLEWYKLLV